MVELPSQIIPESNEAGSTLATENPKYRLIIPAHERGSWHGYDRALGLSQTEGERRRDRLHVPGRRGRASKLKLRRGGEMYSVEAFGKGRVQSGVSLVRYVLCSVLDCTLPRHPHDRRPRQVTVDLARLGLVHI